MIEYFKNAKVYELQNGQVFSALCPGHMTQCWCK